MSWKLQLDDLMFLIKKDSGEGKGLSSLSLSED